MTIWFFVERFKKDKDYKKKYDYLNQVIDTSSFITPCYLLNMEQWFKLEKHKSGRYISDFLFISKNLKKVAVLADDIFIEIGRITNFISIEDNLNPKDYFNTR